jgi:predicted transcriptional regulator
LTAINNESIRGEVRPTRIQFQSNMSYNNLIRYLAELEDKQMITRKPISLTQKGYEYFKNCNAVKDLVHKLGLDQL